MSNHHLQNSEQLTICNVSIFIYVVDFKCKLYLLLLISSVQCGQAYIINKNYLIKIHQRKFCHLYSYQILIWPFWLKDFDSVQVRWIFHQDLSHRCYPHQSAWIAHKVFEFTSVKTDLGILYYPFILKPI